MEGPNTLKPIARHKKSQQLWSLWLILVFTAEARTCAPPKRCRAKVGHLPPQGALPCFQPSRPYIVQRDAFSPLPRKPDSRT